MIRVIHWIKLFPVNSATGFTNTYPSHLIKIYRCCMLLLCMKNLLKGHDLSLEIYQGVIRLHTTDHFYPPLSIVRKKASFWRYGSKSEVTASTVFEKSLGTHVIPYSKSNKRALLAQFLISILNWSSIKASKFI